MPPIEPGDLKGNSSLRLLYEMDDDELLSPDASLQGSFGESMNFSIKSVADWNHQPSSHSMSIRTSEHRETDSPQKGRGASGRVHTSTYRHQQEEHSPAEKRKAIRKSLTQAFVSPVRAAKDKMHLPSPGGKSARGKTKNGKNKAAWQKQLHLPPDIHPDEAIAVLLAKELKGLDF